MVIAVIVERRTHLFLKLRFKFEYLLRHASEVALRNTELTSQLTDHIFTLRHLTSPILQLMRHTLHGIALTALVSEKTLGKSQQQQPHFITVQPYNIDSQSCTISTK